MTWIFLLSFSRIKRTWLQLNPFFWTKGGFTCSIRQLSFITGGWGEGWCNFFSQVNFFMPFRCNPPPHMAQKSYDPRHSTLKDMTGIIKRDQLLPCAVHNRKRVALLPDIAQVATREELSWSFSSLSSLMQSPPPHLYPHLLMKEWLIPTLCHYQTVLVA